MSDAQDLYEQHDNLGKRADVLRAGFLADVEKFGGWDAEEEEIDRRLNEIDVRHDQVHGFINDLEQTEIDRADAEKKPNDSEHTGSKELIAKVERGHADIGDDLNDLEKDIASWRHDNNGDDPEAV